MTSIRIVSGAQTGADRAALDAALAAGIEIGGWVPAGRMAEDGAVSERYAGLRETESANPIRRTRRNVADSDATLIVSPLPLTGGTKATLAAAEARDKPHLVVDLEAAEPDEAAEQVAAWWRELDAVTLNVAGPRASKEPRVYAYTLALLERFLGLVV